MMITHGELDTLVQWVEAVLASYGRCPECQMPQDTHPVRVHYASCKLGRILAKANQPVTVQATPPLVDRCRGPRHA